jgi:hypothetical protein
MKEVNTTNLAHQSNSNAEFTQYFYEISQLNHQFMDGKQWTKLLYTPIIYITPTKNY